jgi:hypothetical protein
MEPAPTPAPRTPAAAALPTPNAPRSLGDEGRLPLVVTIGFTGHRALDDSADAARQLDRSFALIRAAVELLEARTTGQGETLADAYEGPTRLRLMAGDAPGADRLARERWQASGPGDAHMLYPFRDPATGAPLTDHPDHAAPDARLAGPPADAAWTGFDGVGLGLERNSAHVEVGRWIVRHADAVVAVWNGQSATEAGGTGETLRRALERGAPVVWIRPGAAEPLLVSPASVHRLSELDDAMGRLEELCVALTPQTLAELLARALAPPVGARPTKDPEVLARIDYAAVDPLAPSRSAPRLISALADATLWRASRLFERLAGGFAGAGATEPGAAPPPALAAEPGFVRIERAYAEADQRADTLANIHRSQQLLLVFLATVAVLVGALPAMIADKQAHEEAHLWAALTELILGALALLIFTLARRAHRHRRWSDARRLSERLRAARATWPIGIELGDERITAPHTWTEWRAMAVIRAAGPIRGWLTRERFDATAHWIAAELIEGQIAYHTFQHRLAERIDSALQATEGLAFGLLMATLAIYLAVGWGLPERMPPWLPGLVSVVSAFAPAVAAACLALEATSGFGELALRNERLRHEFVRAKAQLGAAHGGGYRNIQEVVRRAAQLLVEDADAWRDRLTRRRLVR